MLISSVYYSLARIGEMYVFEGPHVLFSLAVADAPHRSDRPSMARGNSRPRSVGILRVRGLPLLRRVQVSATTFNWTIAFHRRQSLRRGSRLVRSTKFLGRSKLRENNLAGRRRKKIQLKAKALTSS
jgi:hypothetical protein